MEKVDIFHIIKLIRKLVILLLWYSILKYYVLLFKYGNEENFSMLTKGGLQSVLFLFKEITKQTDENILG